MSATLHIVTGAPGAGKTTTLDALLRCASPHLAFDIDWLADAGSRLAGSDIWQDRAAWPAYNALWFEILHSVHKNGKIAIFFAPLDLRDVAEQGQLDWCGRIEWLLLDCDDATRRARLARRAGWGAARIAEALADAQILREQIPARIDTGLTPPDAAAAAILAWVARTR